VEVLWKVIHNIGVVDFNSWRYSLFSAEVKFNFVTNYFYV